MSLIKCSECENEISSKAKMCVYCGMSRTKTRGLSDGEIIIVFAIFMLFLWLLSIAIKYLHVHF